jgi:hypothetical protein
VVRLCGKRMGLGLGLKRAAMRMAADLSKMGRGLPKFAAKS